MLIERGQGPIGAFAFLKDKRHPGWRWCWRQPIGPVRHQVNNFDSPGLISFPMFASASRFLLSTFKLLHRGLYTLDLLCCLYIS